MPSRFAKTARATGCASLLALTLIPRSGSAGNTPSPPNYAYGWLTSTCGPLDDVEAVLVLTTHKSSCHDRHNYPRVEIYTGEETVKPPQTFSIVESKHGLSIHRCLTAGTCEEATEGFVALDRLREKAIDGHYELKLRNGDTSSGSFVLGGCKQHRFTCP